jgi:formate hydrogenlyase subunit 4
MGSSRDMFVSVLAEPALFAALLAFALPAKSSQIIRIVTFMATNHRELLSPGLYLVLLAFFILVLTETGRIPVDNPDTHLELTMIHEGMLLEYSGKRLGLMLWSKWIKQILLFALLVDFFFPWGMALHTTMASWLLGLIVFLLKVVGLSIAVACTEMSYAKIRFFRIPRLLSAAILLSVMAIATEYLL